MLETNLNHQEASKSNGLTHKKKNILFIDFNGVISYNPFWVSLRDPSHELHQFHVPIEEYLFKNNLSVVLDWMLGKYTAEQIHELLEKHLGVPYSKLFPLFCEDCKQIDLSYLILEKVRLLRPFYYCVLITDNMDTFDRFTVIHNPVLTDSFDRIDNSYAIGRFKKSDNGKYFTDRIAEHGAVIEHCILIDDSKNNCILFESLGGRAYMPKSEKEATDVLDEIIDAVKNKLENIC